MNLYKQSSLRPVAIYLYLTINLYVIHDYLHLYSNFFILLLLWLYIIKVILRRYKYAYIECLQV